MVASNCPCIPTPDPVAETPSRMFSHCQLSSKVKGYMEIFLAVFSPVSVLTESPLELDKYQGSHKRPKGDFLYYLVSSILF